jgi:hypothetical protein
MEMAGAAEAGMEKEVTLLLVEAKPLVVQLGTLHLLEEHYTEEILLHKTLGLVEAEEDGLAVVVEDTVPVIIMVVLAALVILPIRLQ